ncbi:hypothetical protein JTE90_002129 [Oedothorax gibbosus]|uniref:Speckle-type POZ protein n=1 Tax=Oedothorax gibbosus TaxID=931172 RepID=A0AAV6V894_9ARAC|nr:hypothetical protein JTE90_002129 [Oedothorax gibbosus]
MSENVKKFRGRTQLLKEACDFKWSIENFSSICSAKTKVKEPLISETFTTGESSLETEWCIYLNFSDDNSIGIHLKRISNKSLRHYVLSSFSIIGSDEIKYYSTEHEDGDLYNDSSNGWGYSNFVDDRKKLFEEEKLLLLPNDTLTIVCEFQVSVIDASIVSELTQDSNTIHSSKSDFKNPDSLMDDFQHLYASQMFADFTIKVGDEEFKCHKIILCARSSVFHTMLTTDMKENLTNCLEITDFDPSIVKTMIHYIYCGQVQDLTPEISIQLYFIADKYNLQDLKDICVEYILGNINMDNICDVLTLLELHDEPQLKTAARDFICANAVAIQETEKWLSLSKNMPYLILDMNRLVISQMKNTNRSMK